MLVMGPPSACQMPISHLMLSWPCCVWGLSLGLQPGWRIPPRPAADSSGFREDAALSELLLAADIMSPPTSSVRGGLGTVNHLVNYRPSRLVSDKTASELSAPGL